MVLTGSCLCEKVHFESNDKPIAAGHCHCVDCRKTSSTGHATNIALPAGGLTVSGEIKSYARPADSGNIVTRHFCPDCGSPIYSTNSGMDGMVFLRASALDDPEAITPSLSVYTSRAPSWDKADENLPSFAEMPPEMPF